MSYKHHQPNKPRITPGRSRRRAEDVRGLPRSRPPEAGAHGIIHYADIGEYLSREQKLDKIRTAAGISGVDFTTITPNEFGDWLTQRRDDFGTFLAIGDKTGGEAVFSMYSQGVVTARDAWAINFSARRVLQNMETTIQFYESERARVASLPANARAQALTRDSTRIAWGGGIDECAAKGRPLALASKALRVTSYRPFTRQWLYFDRTWNNRVYQLPRFFPVTETPNVGFYLVAAGSDKPWSALATDVMPDAAMWGSSSGQYFGRWVYESVEEGGQLEFGADAANVISGFRRTDNVTDGALRQFQAAYGDAVTKDDVFDYVYGLLILPSTVRRTRPT